jgi:hypothetical protein
VVLESLRTPRRRSIYAYDALIYMYDCPIEHATPTYKFTGKEAKNGIPNPS